MKKYTYLIVAMLLWLPMSLSAQTDTGSILIKGGTVITVANGTLENTDILIENGIITQIGEGVSAPNGVKVVDAAGKFVMPGIVDAHSHIALDAINEATSPVTAEVFTGDALDPFDVSIYRALAGGVTISHAMHGSANAIGGECETIKHRYGVTNPNHLKMADAPRTIKFALGENPTRVYGRGSGIQPRTRMGVEQIFRNSFNEAQDYRAKWQAYGAGERTMAPEYNKRMETLVSILEGDVIIHCHSYRADEILMLMEVCKDFGIEKLVFQHVNEGFKVAPELAAFGASASVFSDWWAYKFEVYYSTAYNAAILAQNGVNTSINSDSGELIRHLYHEAAKSQRYGELTDEQALALITINPAKQLGIEDRVGTIEKGKEGDIAVFSAHPLSVYAIPELTVVDGMIRFDRANDPDDMRIYADPEEDLKMPVFSSEQGHQHHHDRCMQDVHLLFH